MITILIQIFLLSVSLQAIDAKAADGFDAPRFRDESVRVVELFTSQGCPMCPGANLLLAEMGETDPGILALAYGVSYWDVYGWRDTFAADAFVARQQAYVDAGEARRVYTPHFVINGSPEQLRFNEEAVRGAVHDARSLPVLIDANHDGETITVRLDGPQRDREAQVWAVAYHPGIETREIKDGPNAGREMVHYNMVREIRPVASWIGGRVDITLDAPADGLAAAILVQAGPGERILSAARAD